MNEFQISYPAGQLDISLCVGSGQVFRWERLLDGAWLGVDGDHWYLVREDGPDTLKIRSNAKEADFEAFFRLDWDAKQIERKVLEQAPEMEPYLAQLRGLRLLKPTNPVEAMFSFLCTPNNNLTRIVPMVRSLASYGPILDTVAGRPIHRFPDVATIAEIPPIELRAKAFGYRAETIPSVAKQVLALGGDEWVATRKLEPYGLAHSNLCEIKGIGPKLADCICLFAFHHMEAVPVDTHILQAAVRLYFPELKDKPLTDSRYRQIGDHFRAKFGDLTGWAHQYLFYDNLLHWRERR